MLATDTNLNVSKSNVNQGGDLCTVNEGKVNVSSCNTQWPPVNLNSRFPQMVSICVSIGDAIRGAYLGIDQNGYGFSTIDRDNDGCSPCIFGDIAETECSFSEGGSWWYSRCGSASLNGDWHPAGDHIGWASGLHWETWKSRMPYSLKASRMMIKSV